MLVFVIASEAKQSNFVQRKLDCFVALLLAMTLNLIKLLPRPGLPVLPAAE